MELSAAATLRPLGAGSGVSGLPEVADRVAAACCCLCATGGKVFILLVKQWLFGNRPAA